MRPPSTLLLFTLLYLTTSAFSAPAPASVERRKNPINTFPSSLAQKLFPDATAGFSPLEPLPTPAPTPAPTPTLRHPSFPNASHFRIFSTRKREPQPEATPSDIPPSLIATIRKLQDDFARKNASLRSNGSSQVAGGSRSRSSSLPRALRMRKIRREPAIHLGVGTPILSNIPQNVPATPTFVCDIKQAFTFSEAQLKACGFRRTGPFGFGL